ncbi:MAG: DUF1059 domain-containing protein [Deltaproteobacteria bacterium]|nr:DUF1059 domain-containing protein [Deltaproteobacteria bacterium]
MPYTISCKEAGVDCNFVSEGKTEEELLRNVQEHVKKAHGMKEIPSDLLTRINRLIKEDKAA